MARCPPCWPPNGEALGAFLHLLNFVLDEAATVLQQYERVSDLSTLEHFDFLLSAWLHQIYSRTMN